MDTIRQDEDGSGPCQGGISMNKQVGAIVLGRGINWRTFVPDGYSYLICDGYIALFAQLLQWRDPCEAIHRSGRGKK